MIVLEDIMGLTWYFENLTQYDLSVCFLCFSTVSGPSPCPHIQFERLGINWLIIISKQNHFLSWNSEMDTNLTWLGTVLINHKEIKKSFFLHSKIQQKLSSQVAKAAFQRNNDPLDAAIFYLAMRKKAVIWGLYR